MNNELVLTRKVTVYNTVGQNERALQTDARTWGELQTHMSRASIPYSNMKCVVGETQVTLESRDAQVPQSDFTLFLLPSKVRSGVSLN
jgi:hypothetical protein